MMCPRKTMFVALAAAAFAHPDGAGAQQVQAAQQVVAIRIKVMRDHEAIARSGLIPLKSQGRGATLTVIGLDSAGKVAPLLHAFPRWTTSDADVVSLDSMGLISNIVARKDGRVTVTISALGLTDTIPVVVGKARFALKAAEIAPEYRVARLVLREVDALPGEEIMTGRTLRMKNNGGGLRIRARIYNATGKEIPLNDEEFPIEWTTSDRDIIEVYNYYDADGQLVGREHGRATVTVSIHGLSVSLDGYVGRYQSQADPALFTQPATAVATSPVQTGGATTVPVPPAVPPSTPVATPPIPPATTVPNPPATTLPSPPAATSPSPAGIDLVEVAAGDEVTCARSAAFISYCWGSGMFGMRGDGTTTNQATPTLVGGGIGFTRLVAGNNHTCGMTAAGVTYCWGRGSHIGDGTVVHKSTPTLVSGGFSFVDIVAGSSHTCGRTAVNVAYCWGEGSAGQLGDGSSAQRLTPTPVSGGHSFVELVAGAGHTCGRTVSNQAYCWGSGDQGQLGGGSKVSGSNTPTLVWGGLPLSSLTAGPGGRHTCGRGASGRAYCWGSNTEGQLGDGTLVDRATPTAVVGGITFIELVAGGLHTCGRTAAHVTHCWGWDVATQHGDISRSQPTLVSGGLDFVELTAGWIHTCGRAADNVLYCWGANTKGQLGDGTTVQRASPVRVFWP